MFQIPRCPDHYPVEEHPPVFFLVLPEEGIAQPHDL